MPTAEDVLPVTSATRTAFLTVGAWGALMTVPMSIGQVTGHARDPSTRTFKRWARRWARTILGAGRVRVWLDDRANLDPVDGPYVFVCNHQTALDILVLADALPYPFGFAAKAELAEVPFLGRAIRQSPGVFVDRRTPRRAVETVKEAGERIRSGMSVLVFPEGRRSYRAEPLPLERGAFMIALEAGVPLVPVVLLGAYRVLDERRQAFRPGTVGVVVHPPIETAGLTRHDLPALMARVAAWMREEIEADEQARATA
ncbi:MAG: 1-acyl-sn-glycerol-3-phosphate acyltransferase [Bacteroidetes bacterium]|nr:1-acyl-sn-glycerol-3-phosphate acyltransferase [Bacteroidota bacterium]